MRCSIADAGEEARNKILKVSRPPPDSTFRILKPQCQRTGKVNFIPFFTGQARYSCFYGAMYNFTRNWNTVFFHWFFPTRTVTVLLQSHRKRTGKSMSSHFLQDKLDTFVFTVRCTTSRATGKASFCIGFSQPGPLQRDCNRTVNLFPRPFFTALALPAFAPACAGSHYLQHLRVPRLSPRPLFTAFALPAV